MAQTLTAQVRERVYNFVLRSGAAGLTDEEIGLGLHIDGDTCRPRRNELVRAQRLVNSGFRRLTKRGRTAIVWISQKVADKRRSR